MLSFKPTFSLSSFTFLKRLFSCFSLSAIRVVSHSVTSSSLRPHDYSLPGSSVHGILQTRKLYCSIELPFPSPRDLPNPEIESASPALQADSLPLGHQGSLALGLPASKMDSRVGLPSEHDGDLRSKKICKALDGCLGRGWYVMGAARGPQPQHC